MLVLAGVGYLLASADGAGGVEALAGGIGGLVIVMPLAFWYKGQMARRIWRKTPGVLGERTLEISPSGFHITSPDIEVRRSWKTLRELQATPTDLIFHGKGVGVLAVPTSAFGSQVSAEEFVAEAHSYWRPVVEI